jgi:hypothetical protein
MALLLSLIIATIELSICYLSEESIMDANNWKQTFHQNPCQSTKKFAISIKIHTPTTSK